MSRRERVYYICDYCKKEVTSSVNAYTDNEGYGNITIDICNDPKCMEQHMKYIGSRMQAFAEKAKTDSYYSKYVMPLDEYKAKYVKPFWH